MPLNMVDLRHTARKNIEARIFFFTIQPVLDVLASEVVVSS